METDEPILINQLQLMQSYTMDIRDFAYEKDLRLRYTKYPVLTKQRGNVSGNIIGNIIFKPDLILRYQIYRYDPTLFRIELIKDGQKKVRYAPFVEIYRMIVQYHREIVLEERNEIGEIDVYRGKNGKAEVL